MNTQVRSKQFRARFTGYFAWYLVIYIVITYLFREKGEEFWSLSNLSDKIAFALFMGLIVAVWNPSKNQTPKLQSDPVVNKPTGKEFVGTYLVILIFILPLLVILITFGWGLIGLFSHNEEPFWPVLLKSIIITAVLCLLINTYFSIAQLISYRRQKKNL